MSKNWKKKYKKLKKENDHLLCENIRLRTDDTLLKNATDEQILAIRDMCDCVTEKIHSFLKF